MVVKNSHFHLILNHWFQFYFTIATHDRVFHDDLYTSINFWAAREIRTFFEQKNDLIWFFFEYLMFQVIFYTWKMSHHHAAVSEPPQLAIRPLTLPIQRVEKKQRLTSWGREHSRTFVRQKRFMQKEHIFKPIYDHGFYFCPLTVNFGGIFYFVP